MIISADIVMVIVFTRSTNLQRAVGQNGENRKLLIKF